jgi:hypothetical protein
VTAGCAAFAIRYSVFVRRLNAVPRKLLDQPPELEPRPRIEPRRGLVHDEDERPTDQARAQIDPAAHPARVGEHPAVPRRGQGQALQHLSRPRSRLLATQAVEPADELEGLAAGEGRVDSRCLAGPVLRTGWHLAQVRPGRAEPQRPRMRRSVANGQVGH